MAALLWLTSHHDTGLLVCLPPCMVADFMIRARAATKRSRRSNIRIVAPHRNMHFLERVSGIHTVSFVGQSVIIANHASFF